jgi:hypothetical protein
MPDAVDTVVCAPNDGWKYQPKHVQQFPDINKLCEIASCWIYEYIGILLGARPILHISRIKVNCLPVSVFFSEPTNHILTRKSTLPNHELNPHIRVKNCSLITAR